MHLMLKGQHGNIKKQALNKYFYFQTSDAINGTGLSTYVLYMVQVNPANPVYKENVCIQRAQTEGVLLRPQNFIHHNTISNTYPASFKKSILQE